MLGDLLRAQKAAALYQTTSGANNCVCKAGIVLGSSIQAAISLEPQAYSCDASCKTPCCSTSLTLLACLHTETDQKSYSRIRGSYTRIVLGLQIHTLPYSGLTPCVDKPLHKQEQVAETQNTARLDSSSISSGFASYVISCCSLTKLS